MLRSLVGSEMCIRDSSQICSRATRVPQGVLSCREVARMQGAPLKVAEEFQSEWAAHHSQRTSKVQLPFGVTHAQLDAAQLMHLQQHCSRLQPTAYPLTRISESGNLTTTSKASFRAVDGLASHDSVSLESCARPGHFLRASYNGELRLTKLPAYPSDRFRDAASFMPRVNKWAPQTVAFESAGSPGSFVAAVPGSKLRIRRATGSAAFGKTASFIPHQVKDTRVPLPDSEYTGFLKLYTGCLLYTSDAADEEDSVDLGGSRVLDKKRNRMTE
eukprot:TRINITY_DN63391_c0_g1_i1.p1 TRINITY_DN63391_c0_g1~~TRINITY_DN63391_c0_g1_i1.p1  ORF type:complete len:314 (+),score=75.28 TRINITY_DN63391_c0_g1_i1:126-944(+)